MQRLLMYAVDVNHGNFHFHKNKLLEAWFLIILFWCFEPRSRSEIEIWIEIEIEILVFSKIKLLEAWLGE